MARLVGVVHENEDDPNYSSSSKCLARRQLPITIEKDLTMIMALDDACLACCSSTLHDMDDKASNEIVSSVQTFLRRYNALNRDEVTAALMVNFDDIMNTLSSEVSCVGCRRSVESMLQKLYSNGDPALEPLVIAEDKVISVGRDHITTPQALANLFCNQLHRLRTTYIDPVTGPKNRKKGGNLRCQAHSLGLGSKHAMSLGHWTSTWKCMERECQEECLLIHFDLLKETIDRYLKKHSFCDECKKMVNKAYQMLVEDEDIPNAVNNAGNSNDKDHHGHHHHGNYVHGHHHAPDEDSNGPDDTKRVKTIYNGLTSCVSDQHVHVECKEETVADLIELAVPELSGLTQERHAKTIEAAQKEVLTCIGICLCQRLQRIQQRLLEGQQACDLLFYVALQSLKHSFEMAFESKQGISELEKLCQEFDEEDRKKQEKAQKKREKKKKQKQAKTTSGPSEPSEVTASADVKKPIQPGPKPTCAKISAKENTSKQTAVVTNGKQTAVVTTNGLAPSCNGIKIKESSQQLILKKLENKSCRTRQCDLFKTNEPISVLKLASMLEQDNMEDDNNSEDEIPQEEIQQYLQEVSQQRAELRKTLHERFAQLCDNGF